MLKRNTTGTLYGQLCDQIMEKINNEIWKVGDKIPTEEELCEIYKVSRTTVRKALDELERSGFVRREIAKGTFVTEPINLSTRPPFFSYTKEILSLGYEPGAKLLLRDIRALPKIAAKDLELQYGEHVLHLRRLRTADGLPTFVSDSYLNSVKFPELLIADYNEMSLLNLFSRILHANVCRAKQWISAGVGSPETCELLELKENATILIIKRILFIQDDIPLETVTSFLHPEYFIYYSEISLD